MIRSIWMNSVINQNQCELWSFSVEMQIFIVLSLILNAVLTNCSEGNDGIKLVSTILDTHRTSVYSAKRFKWTNKLGMTFQFTSDWSETPRIEIEGEQIDYLPYIDGKHIFMAFNHINGIIDKGGLGYFPDTYKFIMRLIFNAGVLRKMCLNFTGFLVMEVILQFQCFIWKMFIEQKMISWRKENK